MIDWIVRTFFVKPENFSEDQINSLSRYDRDFFREMQRREAGEPATWTLYDAWSQYENLKKKLRKLKVNKG